MLLVSSHRRNTHDPTTGSEKKGEPLSPASVSLSWIDSVMRVWRWALSFLSCLVLPKLHDFERTTNPSNRQWAQEFRDASLINTRATTPPLKTAYGLHVGNQICPITVLSCIRSADFATFQNITCGQGSARPRPVLHSTPRVGRLREAAQR